MAWRPGEKCARFNPKTEVQAMAFQEEAMKLTAAKSVSEILGKLDQLEDLDRQCEEHRGDKQGIDIMTKKVIMHQILPPSISNFLLLENRNSE